MPPSRARAIPLAESTSTRPVTAPKTAFTADGEEWKAPADFFRETVTIAER